jgi:hypothetical protein
MTEAWNEMRMGRTASRARGLAWVTFICCFSILTAYAYNKCIKGNHYYIMIPIDCTTLPDGSWKQCQRVNCYDIATWVHVNCGEECLGGYPYYQCHDAGSASVRQFRDFKNCLPNKQHGGCDPLVSWAHGVWNDATVVRKYGDYCPPLPGNPWYVYY